MLEKVTEAEIIDVLLGDADPALVEKVLQAVALDDQAAAVYEEWARFVPMVQEQTGPLREMITNVESRVRERLPYEFPALYTSSLPLSRSEKTGFLVLWRTIFARTQLDQGFGGGRRGRVCRGL